MPLVDLTVDQDHEDATRQLEQVVEHLAVYGAIEPEQRTRCRLGGLPLGAALALDRLGLGDKPGGNGEANRDLARAPAVVVEISANLTGEVLRDDLTLVEPGSVGKELGPATATPLVDQLAERGVGFLRLAGDDLERELGDRRGAAQGVRGITGE